MPQLMQGDIFSSGTPGLHSNMTTPFPARFHIPGENEETEEQISYEEQIWLQSDHRDANQDGCIARPSERSLDRGLGHTRQDGDSSSALKTSLKSFVRGLKSTSQSAASLVSLESRLSKELDDPAHFPEVSQQAIIRKGLDLCPEEMAYHAARRLKVKEHFAKFVGLDAAQVHPDDVPTVSFGGSGGGYRAMLAFVGYSLAMKKAGVWDLLTYVAGVSGSCE
jgi:cytosolic phospholipase A2